MSHGLRDHNAYGVGIICALPFEKAAVTAMLDEEHPRLQNLPGDHNDYTLGRMGRHDVVVACLPAGVMSKASAAVMVVRMMHNFPIAVSLMVGIGGGVPNKIADIRLGDVVVSQPSGLHGGVVEWDFGKMERGGVFRRTGTLNKPPRVLLHALARLQIRHEIDGLDVQRHIAEMLLRRPGMAKAFGHPGRDQDLLFAADYDHASGETCAECDTTRRVIRPPRDDEEAVEIFYGNIASADTSVEDGRTRDRIAKAEELLCFETEAAMLIDIFPCVAIRGICDYADSHKQTRWQRYAATAASAYAKELLDAIDPTSVEELKPARKAKHHIPLNRKSIALAEEQSTSHTNKPTGVTLSPDVAAGAAAGFHAAWPRRHRQDAAVRTFRTQSPSRFERDPPSE